LRKEKEKERMGKPCYCVETEVGLKERELDVE